MTAEEQAAAEAENAKLYPINGGIRSTLLALLGSLVTGEDGRVCMRGVQVSVIGMLQMALQNAAELPAPKPDEPKE